MTDRLKPSSEFSTMEMLVAVMVGRGLEYEVIGNRLSISKSTVKMHAQNASAKLPGKDAPRMKLQVWWRGGDEELMSPRLGEVVTGD